MRCPDCSKFVSLEMQDPEVSSIEISEDGNVSVEVRIVRACAECGTELKEATLNMEESLDITDLDELGAHMNAEGEDKHDLLIEEDSVNQIEEGGSRYTKSYYGAEVSYRVTCKCQEKEKEAWSYDGTISDKVAASEMEEMV